MDSRFIAEDVLVIDEKGRSVPIERRICVSPAFVADHPEYGSVLLSSKFENVLPLDPSRNDRGQVALRTALEREPSGALGRLSIDRAEAFFSRLV